MNTASRRLVLVLSVATALPAAAQEADRPSHRVAQGVAFDAARGRLVLFGGVAFPAQDPLGDTWEWDGTRWYRFTTATAPSPRGAPAMAYDAARGRVVLYGGLGEEQVHDDTWEWDGVRWTPIDATGPGARAWHVLYYDAARERVRLLGGLAGGEVPTDDIWEWDGTSWTRVLEAVAMEGPSPFARARERAYRAAMLSDLRNLVTAQEMYYADHLTYAESLDMLGTTYRTSSGVTVTVLTGTATGWSATAVHERVPQARCGVFIGDAGPPLAVIEQEGRPACTGFDE